MCPRAHALRLLGAVGRAAEGRAPHPPRSLARAPPTHLRTQRWRELLCRRGGQAQLDVQAAQPPRKLRQLLAQEEEEGACRDGQGGWVGAAAESPPVGQQPAALAPYRSLAGTWWRRPAAITSSSGQPCTGNKVREAVRTHSGAGRSGSHVPPGCRPPARSRAAGRCPPPECSRTGGGTGRCWARCGAR